MKKYLIGITTGRAGSMSFAQFLNNQPDIHFTHEACGLAFWPIFDSYPRALQSLKERSASIVGDISPMWVMYLDRIVRDVGRGNIKILWLDRGNLDQVATSFDSYKRYEKQLKNKAFGMFPVFEQKYSRDGVKRTVQLINFLIGCAEKQFGDIMAKVEMKDLNSEDMQRNLLRWLGLPTESHVYGMERKNIRHDLVKKFRKMEQSPMDPGKVITEDYDIGTENDPYKDF